MSRRAAPSTSALFGWEFENPYPAFFRTSSSGETVGAVQGRRALLDVPTNGPEVTFAVDDLGVALAAVETGGGRVLMSEQPRWTACRPARLCRRPGRQRARVDALLGLGPLRSRARRSSWRVADVRNVAFAQRNSRCARAQA